MNDTPTRTMPVVPTPPVLDNKEAVAKVKSSNGDLRIPRKATPWLLAATSAIASGLVLCAAQHPDESVRLFCAIGATVVQTFGSGISGGLGKKPKT